MGARGWVIRVGRTLTTAGTCGGGGGAAANGVLDNQITVAQLQTVQGLQGGGGLVDLVKLDEGEALLQVQPDDGTKRGEPGLQMMPGGGDRVEVNDEKGLTRVCGPASSLVLPPLNSAISPCPLDLERSTPGIIQGGAIQGLNSGGAVVLVNHEDEGEAALEVDAGDGPMLREQTLEVGDLAVVLEVAHEDGAGLRGGGLRRGGGSARRRGGRGCGGRGRARRRRGKGRVAGRLHEGEAGRRRLAVAR